MNAHEESSTVRNTCVCKKTEMMITRLESRMQRALHKLPARTPSTKTMRGKGYVQAVEINTNSGTDYKRWLPKG